MPKVLILRGIAGSGKTTYATNLPESAEWFSADDFWTDAKGNYNFDPKRIGEAHAWNFKQFVDSLYYYSNTDKDGPPDLYIVDNTSISAWEIAPYVLAASAFGLDHEIITIACNPEVAAARNTHGVPANVVWEMWKRLIHENLPPFWNHKVVFGS